MKLFLTYLLFITSTLYSCSQSTTTASKNKLKMNNKLVLSDTEWKEKLTPNQYYILRQKGTERPFSGEFVITKEKGTYKCAGCGTSLFTDDMKFESHCGWPSFDKEIAGGKINQHEDFSHGMHRTEITCATCGGHLGHIFDDGPTATGKRYCVNSGALQFEPAQPNNNGLDTLTLGGGCFWCIEAVFEQLKGVQKVESGYSGGKTINPTYKEVCTGLTHHAEVVNITFNPQIISIENLLEVFFTVHNPTTLNQQGADVGTQYRSVIFYRNKQQQQIAENVIATLNANKVFDNPIITEVVAFSHFYIAENYHQEYYELNKEQPYCKMIIKPKMDKLHKVFADKLKAEKKSE